MIPEKMGEYDDLVNEAQRLSDLYKSGEMQPSDRDALDRGVADLIAERNRRAIEAACPWMKALTPNPRP